MNEMKIIRDFYYYIPVEVMSICDKQRTKKIINDDLKGIINDVKKYNNIKNILHNQNNIKINNLDDFLKLKEELHSLEEACKKLHNYYYSIILLDIFFDKWSFKKDDIIRRKKIEDKEEKIGDIYVGTNNFIFNFVEKSINEEIYDSFKKESDYKIKFFLIKKYYSDFGYTEDEWNKKKILDDTIIELTQSFQREPSDDEILDKYSEKRNIKIEKAKNEILRLKDICDKNIVYEYVDEKDEDDPNHLNQVDASDVIGNKSNENEEFYGLSEDERSFFDILYDDRFVKMAYEKLLLKKDNEKEKDIDDKDKYFKLVEAFLKKYYEIRSKK